MSDVTSQASGDWFEDERISFDEAVARFESMGPEATSGPLPPGARTATTPRTFGVTNVVYAKAPALSQGLQVASSVSA